MSGYATGRGRRLAPAGAALLAVAGCASLAPSPAVRPLHLTEVAGEGDPARRASTRIALEALDADARGAAEAARERLDRALRVDPTNPWAWLALARHRAEGPRPADALSALDQAEARLRAEGALGPGVSVHLDGLRGVALSAGGDPDRGRELLGSASRRAPGPWGDGRLGADELR